MVERERKQVSGRFDINEIARSFPATADSMLLDRYLTDEPEASARVFRVYQGTPAHYHAACDEYLYVVSGRERSGSRTLRLSANSRPAISSSSSGEQCTRCRIFSKPRSCSCPSIRPGATRKILSS